MIFTSFVYLLFLTFVVGFTFSLSLKWRPGFLVLASLAFYGYWKIEYVPLLAFLTAINYIAAQYIHRRFVWAGSVIANLGILVIFKYLGFFANELNDISAWMGGSSRFPVISFLLPLGLSFQTLQMIAYVTDVRRKVIVPERNFIAFALFVTWFPKLIAGPIERGSHLLSQVHRISQPHREVIYTGLRLILIGYFKKLVIADPIMPLVNSVSDIPSAFPVWQNWLILYGFGIQLYFDFSGYMDIAKGSSLLFGIKLSENFRSPFSARSLPEFWRRWHITLTSWLFEYIYYPLVRKFPRGLGPALCVLSVFAFSGLWHGANWNYIIWGLVHGFIYCIYLFTPSFPSESRWLDPLRVLVTFNIVCLTWVLFRSSSLHHALEIYHSLLTTHGTLDLWRLARFKILAISFALFFWLFYTCYRIEDRWPKLSFCLLVMMVLTFGEFASQTFIYSQF